MDTTGLSDTEKLQLELELDKVALQVWEMMKSRTLPHLETSLSGIPAPMKEVFLACLVKPLIRAYINQTKPDIDPEALNETIKRVTRVALVNATTTLIKSHLES